MITNMYHLHAGFHCFDTVSRASATAQNQYCNDYFKAVGQSHSKQSGKTAA